MTIIYLLNILRTQVQTEAI